MRYFLFLMLGTVFGITLIKSEAASWYRIQEMFLFDSFHMYGIIGTAVVFGLIYILIIKRFSLKGIDGRAISIPPKEKGVVRYLLGGTLFGLGWAMTGACPGPMYTLLGYGFPIMLVIIASALLGAFTYGLLKDKLPH